MRMLPIRIKRALANLRRKREQGKITPEKAAERKLVLIRCQYMTGGKKP